jgi:hypothetical protein
LDFLDDSLSPQQALPWQSPPLNPPEVQAPSLPLKQPHQSQQIATTRHPIDDDAPACNTQSCTQARSINQEAILACIHVHNDITSHPFMANQASHWRFPREILNAVLNTNTGALMEMRHLRVNPEYKELWGMSYAIKLGCLAQGIPGVSKGTDTIVFIGQDDVPINQCKDVTYKHVCVNYRPEKANPNCTRPTVGKNCITYPGNWGTPTVDMVTVKNHLNSIVSTKGARYCTINLKDFYLNTSMARPEFMRMKLAELPKEFAQIYKLHDLANANGFGSIKTQKGMYGLPQAGILAQELLKKRLNKHGYHQSPITPGLWRHNFCPISFTLCVDNFGIKYVGCEHVEHLSCILKEPYKCSQDWSGARYLGMTVD